jgi:A/G-specific adenine glycosylase
VHQEPFPWRSSHDPYAAMVAAVAAQQTQMSRVLQIYERWMEAFPTLTVLASADRAEVLRIWGRAGYPRRAAALQEAARICVERHDGAMPRDPAALLALPGVGPFTAAIIRTFGFQEDVAAVDTNIVRVIGRLAFGDLQPAKETEPAAIVAMAERLLPPGRAADWNPALMDYGARVCLPRPRCEECVVASLCAARSRFEAGEVAEPVRAQGRFQDSDRMWRGRILQHLRDLPASNRGGVPGTTISALMRRLATDGMPEAERTRVRGGRPRLGAGRALRTRAPLGPPPRAPRVCEASSLRVTEPSTAVRYPPGSTAGGFPWPRSTRTTRSALRRT